MESPGVTPTGPLQDRESPRHGLSQLSQSRTTSQHLAFTQAVRVPAGHDLIVIGGQNGVDSSGRVVPGDLAGQARQALSNLQACLREASADLDHVGQWSILIKDGAPLYEGFAAFVEIWGQHWSIYAREPPFETHT